MAWFPAAAQAVSQLATGAINYFGQKQRQKQEFAYNQMASNQAYKRDLNMWNKQNELNMQLWKLQNEYNLPINQKQRLIDAGLNPNLIASNASAGGQATAIQKAESPRYQAPRARFDYQPLRTPDVLSMYQNFALRQAQIDNFRAQEDLTKQKALTEIQMRDPKYYKAIHEATVKYVQASYSDVMADLELKKNEELLAKAKAEKGLKQYELQWMKDFGMRPNDPLHYRWLMRLLGQFGNDLIK